MWGNVRIESEMRLCWHIFSISSGRDGAQCLLELDFGPPFLLGQGLPLTCVHLAVSKSFPGQLVGWPNLFTLAALRGEFFRESSHPPTPSVRLMACPFAEGEGDAQ